MVAPDGGWGWLVVFGAFMVWFMVNGMERSFGIWYVEILNQYDSDASLTAWISGINTGLRLLLAPLASAMCRRWSPRTVAMLGGLLYGLAFFASAFVDDIFLLLLLFGVVSGIGGAMAYLPCYMIVAEYFDKYRSVAFGIAGCGSGTGSLVISLLFTYLFSSYSYFETVTIMAGVTLNIIPAAALFAPAHGRSMAPALIKSIKGHRRLVSSHSFLAATEKSPDNISRPRADEDGQLFAQSGRYPDMEKMPLLEKGGHESAQSPERPKSKSFPFHLLTNPVVLLIMLGSFLFEWCSVSYNILVVDFAIERGISETASSIIPTACGAIEIPARLLPGLVLQLNSVRPLSFVLWSCCAVLLAVTTAVTTQCVLVWQFVITASLNTVGMASFFAIAPIAFSLYFVDDVFSDVMGLYSAAQDIGSLTGTVLSGWLRDISRSYAVSYYTMTGDAVIAFSLLLGCFGVIVRLRKTRRFCLRKSVS